jgi:Amt family ammonium transporter
MNLRNSTLILGGLAALGCGVACAAEPLGQSGDTAWMLVCTVLVMLMAVPGVMLFYGGMMRTKHALSIAGHTLAASAMVTLVLSLIHI